MMTEACCATNCTMMEVGGAISSMMKEGKMLGKEGMVTPGLQLFIFDKPLCSLCVVTFSFYGYLVYSMQWQE